MENQFLYELHLHTRESSPCAVTPAAEMVREYKERGYTGMIVTDHFIAWSTHWNERIEKTVAGYLAAKEEGDKIGLDVFFGFEYNYRAAGDDFVTFGVDIDFLLAHPELCEYSLSDYSTLIRENGGLVWQAHPFRRAAYLAGKPMNPRVFPEVDGMEILSGRTGHEDFNREALDWARAHSLLGFAGSDAHESEDITAGVWLPRRAENTADLVSMLKTEPRTFSCSRYETADFDAYCSPQR